MSKNDLSDYQKEVLKIALLATSKLPKTHSDLDKMIWHAYNTGLKHGEKIKKKRRRRFFNFLFWGWHK